MIVALEVLRRRSPADPVVHRQREVIERQVREMARLIDELVDSSHPSAAREPAFRL
jgi:signal transduction histidine kinase